VVQFLTCGILFSLLLLKNPYHTVYLDNSVENKDDCMINLMSDISAIYTLNVTCSK